jgi:hypothetical protein
MLHKHPHNLMDKLLMASNIHRRKNMRLRDSTTNMHKTTMDPMDMEMVMQEATTINISNRVAVEEAAEEANIRRRTKAILHNKITLVMVEAEAEIPGHKLEV